MLLLQRMNISLWLTRSGLSQALTYNLFIQEVKDFVTGFVEVL